jgi:gliding motility-associated lipoprotein GldH
VNSSATLKFFLPFLSAILFNSCTQLDTFEKNIQIPKHEWSYQLQPEIEFTITDTISPYNVFITVRHTDAYAYKNLWLFVSTQQPGDSSYNKERFELTLQQPDGQWIGSGLNDIWEIRHPLFSNIRFTKKGTYHIRLQQTMRDDPLYHIMNAGIRIEKVKS